MGGEGNKVGQPLQAKTENVTTSCVVCMADHTVCIDVPSILCYFKDEEICLQPVVSADRMSKT